MNIYDPKIHFRYNQKTPHRLLVKVLSMIRGGNNSICIMNDEAVYRGYERLGIPRTDAAKYVVLGCYEPIIMGLEEAEIATTRMNMAKCLELAMNGGCDMTTGEMLGAACPKDFATFEAFFDAFLGQVDYFLDFAIEFAQQQGEHCTEINPSIIYSSSFAECIERGMDVHQFPLRYNNMSLKCIGLATVVDSLMAVKKFVFEQKRVSFVEFCEILARNWEGWEMLRAEILADREKYGNNLERPDRIMCDITEHLGQKYCGRKLRRGGVLRLALDSVSHCITLGKPLAATPDGRLAGEPFSRNMVPNAGMDRGGITAYMQSVLKIDAADFVDATVLDFILHPSAVEGERGLAAFVSLMKIFFAAGGFAAQGNIIHREMLVEAQKYPERYSTLQIRVCGWNEYFVKLGRVKQDLFIAQCEER
jgi:formate C-acetyltransferase